MSKQHFTNIQINFVTSLDEYAKFKYNDNIKLRCNQCDASFDKLKKYVAQHLKTNSGGLFCSNKCTTDFVSNNELKTQVTCAECNNSFTKSNNQISKSTNHFCSRSCSTTFNNKISKKVDFQNDCKTCSAKIASSRIYCNECWKTNDRQGKGKKTRWNTTIGVYRNKTIGKHASHLNMEIRQFARSWNKDLKNLPCQNCAYDKHIEFCHIKPVSSFDDNATLGEVNCKSNLLILCPNCHWEFDNGLLHIKNQANYSDQLSYTPTFLKT